jgi:DNA-directed RNA polymerase subunit RPC12/RpoP
MNKPVVRCRCGHQILAKEVLRTDLYERRAPEGNTREFVYVKYRCQHCKRIGEAFIPESRWDRSILEPQHSELTDAERDHFEDATPISSEEILDFHRELQKTVLFTPPVIAPCAPETAVCADEPSTQAEKSETKISDEKPDPKTDKKSEQPRRLFRRDS